jgi:hypothetical protein
MPTTFSKPTATEAAVFRRSYDEPLPLVPVVDKTNVAKPREIKVNLRQNPAEANGQKFEKVFLEFVENTPEAFCKWRCDVAEYVQGGGLDTPAKVIQGAQHFLGQQHKTTWDTVVASVVPDGRITTDAQVQQIFDAFALKFMTPTARRKQKRYMTSNTMRRPNGWSTKQVADRLTTLNRYLKYLPGTAATFNEEELKDMLIDIHPNSYFQLLIKANYDVDSK